MAHAQSSLKLNGFMYFDTVKGKLKRGLSALTFCPGSKYKEKKEGHEGDVSQVQSRGGP